MPVILIILDNSTRILCRYVVLVPNLKRGFVWEDIRWVPAECGLWGPLLVMAVAKDIITNVLRSSLLRFIKDASGDQSPGDGDEHVTSFISDVSGFLC